MRGAEIFSKTAEIFSWEAEIFFGGPPQVFQTTLVLTNKNGEIFGGKQIIAYLCTTKKQQLFVRP